MFVQRVVSPFKTFQRSLLSDSFLTFQSSKLERFWKVWQFYGKCTVHKRVKMHLGATMTDRILKCKQSSALLLIFSASLSWDRICHVVSCTTSLIKWYPQTKMYVWLLYMYSSTFLHCTCSTCTCTCTRVHVHVHVHVYMYMYMYMYTCTRVHVHVHVHVYMYTCTCSACWSTHTCKWTLSKTMSTKYLQADGHLENANFEFQNTLSSRLRLYVQESKINDGVASAEAQWIIHVHLSSKISRIAV